MTGAGLSDIAATSFWHGGPCGFDDRDANQQIQSPVALLGAGAKNLGGVVVVLDADEIHTEAK